MICEATGIPPAVTGGNRNDVTQLVPLLEAIPPIRGKRGRPRGFLRDRFNDAEKATEDNPDGYGVALLCRTLGVNRSAYCAWLASRSAVAERQCGDEELADRIREIHAGSRGAYGATVIDLATREVIGYAVADHRRAELVTDALRMAAGRGDLQRTSWRRELLIPGFDAIRSLWRTACPLMR